MKLRKILLISVCLCLFPLIASGQTDERFRQQRERMVTRQIQARGVSDPAVLEAMRTVQRHRFVPERYVSEAYNDSPMPIGEGQTISQPYIVAFMTEQLALDATDKVLEIGTGSGYQAAVLSRIVDQVYTVEIIPSLAQSAKERLAELGYGNVTVKEADGYYGWEEQVPFDAIMVTAAAPHIPPPLIEQLKVGGRMIIPLGGVFQVQRLMIITKDSQENIQTEYSIPVRFVPLTGGPRK